METSTSVPVRVYAQGWVVPDILERRSGPGESYPAYPTPLHKGDVVVVMACLPDPEGNLWAMIGAEVWACASYRGKVYIAGEPCKGGE